LANAPCRYATVKSTSQSITCTQVSQSINNHLVDLSRLSQSMVRQVSRSYAQRLTPGTIAVAIIVVICGCHCCGHHWSAGI